MCIEKLKKVWGQIKALIKKIKEFRPFLLKSITWKNTITWFTSHYTLEYTLISTLIVYIITTYENILLNWYNNNIVKYLAEIKPNGWLNLFCISFSIYVIFQFYNRLKNHFVYDSRIIYVRTIITILLIYYLNTNRYTYIGIFNSNFYYIYIIIACVSLPIIASILNSAYRLCSFISDQWTSFKKESKEKNILSDKPIESANEDIFDLKDEALKIATEIMQLDKSQTWSLAINAPWGTGKTSFMNMIIEKLKETDDYFEFINFNPRDSRSYQSIQEDFFTTITNVLSKYDHRCNSLMKDYMASLQLIDNRQIIEKIVNFYKIWNKTELTDKLSDVFGKLPKKILVIIDDFDRLSKEEIMEVLKLIDGNAAFKNLIFLTAYDKEQVNKSLGDSYKTKDACFVDKFFNLEFSIPSRPFRYIREFITKELLNKVLENGTDCESETQLLSQFLGEKQHLLQEFIPTLRDAKRFINQVSVDYQNIKDEVIIEEFILVQLIKYKYPEKYKDLYNKKYTEEDRERYGLLCLKKDYISDIDKNCSDQFLLVLNMLFQNDDEDRRYNYRHIFNKESFYYYFENNIYGALKIKQMQLVFKKPIDTAFSEIDNWLKKEDTTSDFVEYLKNHNLKYLEDPKLTRYAEIVTYIATKYYSRYSTTGLIWNLINIKNYADDGANYFVLDEHHNELKDIILNGIFNAEYDNKYLLARHLHNSFVTDNLKKEDYWITDDDIWPSLKEKFLSLFDTLEESELYDWLLNCFVNFDKFKSPAVTFDPDCISKYKKHINEDPDFYLSGFVSNSINSINCRSTWRHLFKDEVEFEAWLDTYKEKYPLAYNFWKLYKDNNYEIIYYYYEEDIKKMLNNNLVEQVKILEKLHKIEREFINIPDYKDDMDIDEKKKQHEKLVDLCLEFRNIKLNIDIKFYHILHKKLDAKFAKYHLPLGSRIPQ